MPIAAPSRSSHTITASCYRFRFVLRHAGETAEFDRIDRYYDNLQRRIQQMRGSSFETADRAPRDPNIQEKDFKQHREGHTTRSVAIKTLGMKPYPKLYQRLADLREKMGRPDEARAWHRLVLRDFPDDALSLAALERLK